MLSQDAVLIVSLFDGLLPRQNKLLGSSANRRVSVLTSMALPKLLISRTMCGGNGVAQPHVERLTINPTLEIWRG